MTGRIVARPTAVALLWANEIAARAGGVTTDGSPPNQAASRRPRRPCCGRMLMDAFAKRTFVYVGVLATPLLVGTLLARAAILLIG